MKLLPAARSDYEQLGSFFFVERGTELFLGNSAAKLLSLGVGVFSCNVY
jgi:hypothetical protein